MADMRNAYSILVRNSERKRPLGRLTHKWEDKILMAFREMWSECMDWIHLAQDREQWLAVVNKVMNLRVP
jgi:hypothetical protein